MICFRDLLAFSNILSYICTKCRAMPELNVNINAREWLYAGTESSRHGDIFLYHLYVGRPWQLSFFIIEAVAALSLLFRKQIAGPGKLRTDHNIPAQIWTF